MPGASDESHGASVSTAPSRAATRIGRGYYSALTLASMTLWALLLGPVLTTLPEQIDAIAPDGRVTALALVVGIGGVVGIVTNPLIGRLSDITRTRWGRRRPWLAGGVAVIVPVSFLAGNASSLAELIVWWSLLQLGVNMLMAPLSATIPDLVPERRRGLASACLGISWAFAPVLGTAVQALTAIPAATYPALAVLAAAGQAVFLITLRRDDAQPTSDQIAGGRWRDLIPRDRDFGLAWLHRFLFALGQNIALAYLFYYLQDVIRYEQVHPGSSTSDGVLILTAVYAPCVILAAIAAGALSDRTHRFRIYIIGATAVFAGGAVLGAVTASWAGVLALAALTGIGFGAYEAVSMAMTIRLLPEQERRARDLSIINVATMIAIAIGPVVAASMIELSGYAAMFVGAGVTVLASGLVVVFIRGAR